MLKRILSCGGPSDLSSAFRFRLNDADMIFERFDEEIVAIQLQTGVYHSISGSGVDAFLLLPSEPTISELAKALSEKYRASVAIIEKDLEPFLEQMRQESLVIAQPDGARRPSQAAVSHSGPLLEYAPPAIQPFRDLEELFLLDPVHDVGPVGWPQPKSAVVSRGLKECRYRPCHPSAMIFERFDEETLAMNLGTGAYHSLTGAAEDIFLMLADEPTELEIEHALQSKYVAAQQDLSYGVATFLDSLVFAGLAEKVVLESPPEAPPRQLALAKPGVGCTFATPALDTFRDAGAPVWLQASDALSTLSFVRKRFRLPDSGLIYRMAGSDAVVINFEKGLCYLLNASAAAVLRLLEQRPTSSEIVEALGRVYAAGRHDLTASVLVFLHHLSRESLIVAEPAAASSDGSNDGGSRQMEVDLAAEARTYEPFSVVAYRDLQHLFLPFPGTNTTKPEPSRSGRRLASLLRGYHEEAATRAGLTEASYCVAGHNVRIRCSGQLQVSELALALSHLKTSLPAGADFTIQAWDCVSGGPSSNAFLAGYLRDFYARWDEACGPRGEVLAFHSKELPVLYHAGPDILSVIDIENRVGYYLKRDDSPLPYWESGSPFRTILHVWLASLDVQFLHAAAVGTEEGGVVLAGKGGAGKSTAALACLDAGLWYAGDDYCASGWNGAPPCVHSLYNTAKLKGKPDFERFPHLRDRVWNPESLLDNSRDKAMFYLSESSGDRIRAGFPLRAILVPHITGKRDSHLGPCSESQALLALSASTIAQLPMAGAQDLERLGDLAARLPRYTLHLGTEMSQIPAVIRSIL